MFSGEPWLFRSWRRFGLVILFSLVTPTFLLLIYTSRTLGNRLERHAFGELQVLDSLIERQIAEEFVGISRYVESFASRRMIVEAAAEKNSSLIAAQLKLMAENHGRNIRTVFVGTNGLLLAAYPNVRGASACNLSQLAWFRSVSARRSPYVSAVYLSQLFDHEPVVMIATPVLREGVPVGFLGAQYQTAELSGWIQRVLNGMPETVVIADQNGHAVFDQRLLLDRLRAMKATGADLRAVDYKLRDSKNDDFVAARFIPELGWWVYAVLPRMSALRSLVETRQVIIASFIVFTGLFTGVSLVWLKTLFRYAEGVERSNRYLEYLCYSIAHNFRAPLRAITGFAELLREKTERTMDPEGAEFMGRIIQGGRSIDEMIEDLLFFGKLSHSAIEPGRVDLNSFLEAVLPEVRDELEARNARLTIDAGLGQVYADKSFLKIVFKELIANAAKFAHSNRRPEIKIDATVIADSTRIYVRDNGPGIEPRFHEQIFELFLKLDNSTPGTGVGLALARSAVERMGGQIGVTSKPGQGAAFWIELPHV